MTSTRKRCIAAVSALAVSLLTACTGYNAENESAMAGVSARASHAVGEIRQALDSTQAASFEAFIDEISIGVDDDRPTVPESLPWLNVVGVSEDRVASRYPSNYAGFERELTMIAIDEGPSPSVGNVQVFLWAGIRREGGFSTDPGHFFYACADMVIDVSAASVSSVRAACSDVPAILIAASQELPESEVEIGSSWP